MKIGNIVESNSKGQIVIPKQIRDELDIKANTYLSMIVRGEGIYIYPIRDIVTFDSNNQALMEVLKRTRGAWANDDWDKTEKRRKKIEIAGAIKRKKIW